MKAAIISIWIKC